MADLASVEYRPPRPEHLSTVQSLCRIPCIYQASGGQVIVDDPSRPLSTLPISFYPKGASILRWRILVAQ